MSKVINASGTRKKSVARATLKSGKGLIKINSLNLDIYTPEILRLKIQEPLILAGPIANKIDISVRVAGGGINSQSEAVRLAIAKCLVEKDNKLEEIFLEYDRHLLIADVRQREPCKPNDSSARAKRQKSYR